MSILYTKMARFRVPKPVARKPKFNFNSVGEYAALIQEYLRFTFRDTKHLRELGVGQSLDNGNYRYTNVSNERLLSYHIQCLLRLHPAYFGLQLAEGQEQTLGTYEENCISSAVRQQYAALGYEYAPKRRRLLLVVEKTPPNVYEQVADFHLAMQRQRKLTLLLNPDA